MTLGKNQTMKNYIGTWRGVSTTIPDYVVQEDVLIFNENGTINYKTKAKDGKEIRIDYTTKSDSEDMIFFPVKGTQEVRRDGYRIRITELSDVRISIRLGANTTIYERQN